MIGWDQWIRKRKIELYKSEKRKLKKFTVVHKMPRYLLIYYKIFWFLLNKWRLITINWFLNEPVLGFKDIIFSFNETKNYIFGYEIKNKILNFLLYVGTYSKNNLLKIIICSKCIFCRIKWGKTVLKCRLKSTNIFPELNLKQTTILRNFTQMI